MFPSVSALEVEDVTDDNDSDEDYQEDANDVFLTLPYVKDQPGYKKYYHIDIDGEEVVNDAQLGEYYHINGNIKDKGEEFVNLYIHFLL